MTRPAKPLDPNAPASPSRRRLLGGIGLMGGAAAASMAGALSARADADRAEPPLPDTTDSRLGAYPFHGEHQAGVTTRRHASLLLVAFNILATNPADLQRLFETLTERIAFLTAGGPIPARDAGFPPEDSGILGPVVTPDNLTVTVALGSSVFAENRYGLERLKPRQLRPMDRFPNDAIDAKISHGDLLLQFCANTAETNIHALRDIVRKLPGLLMVRWQQNGFVIPDAPTDGHQRTERNLFGFKDGTANPNSSDAAAMNRIVWVQPNSGEPDWAAGGSYQVVRVIRHFVERWDRTSLREQERVFGRDKEKGAPLGQKNEFDLPDYAADPDGKVIPHESHMRLANPRRPETEKNLILRRPYNYSRGITESGQMDMGLLFIAFQASLDDGFVAVQNRLNGEPLEEYIKPIGGGYYFVLPGSRGPHEPLGAGLFRGA
ncbi:iron uptake transporter deferrochelatase/peroxidase subunit [Mangrovicella endophytica]|uniref:iron uptake transporter deferrochelatase/peroxidase subunit n=1 Tax=Mangrovicella endophytica TaxID=2066697 RepID=UPI000C9E6CD3|nr:iron uptake transporter deferrochelatase/peroxidase subunit [Mangrovicella endophytica]